MPAPPPRPTRPPPPRARAKSETRADALAVCAAARRLDELNELAPLAVRWQCSLRRSAAAHYDHEFDVSDCDDCKKNVRSSTPQKTNDVKNIYFSSMNHFFLTSTVKAKNAQKHQKSIQHLQVLGSFPRQPASAKQELCTLQLLLVVAPWLAPGCTTRRSATLILSTTCLLPLAAP